MTSKHWIAVLVLSTFAIVGCPSGDKSTQTVADKAQSLVVSYDAEDLDEEVPVDLTKANVVYVLDAFASTDLAQLTVITSKGARTLRDVLGVLPLGEVSLVLGAEPERVNAYLNGQSIASAAQSTEDGLGVSVQALRKVRCCDDCVDVGGGGIGPLVCHGCRGCDD